MRRINPLDPLWHLHRLNIRQINRNSLIIAPHKHTLQRLVLIRIDLLMRHIRWHEDKIPRTRLSRELEFLAPTHAGFAFDDVDDGFQVAVVVGAGFGVGVDVHCAGPDLLGSRASEVDGCCEVHEGCLGGVGVERVGGDNAEDLVFQAVGGRGWDFLLLL